MSDLRCVNGHDRCYLGPDPACPYCERIDDIAVAMARGLAKAKMIPWEQIRDELDLGDEDGKGAKWVWDGAQRRWRLVTKGL